MIADDAAERGLIPFLKAVYGAARCGRPAMFMTPIGTPVCAECGQRMRIAHESGKTLYGMLTARPDFPLTPLQ